MASRFAAHQQEEIFDVYGGNDFQYSNFEYNPNNKTNEERKGRTSVPNYMRPTQASRRRTRSADARPQYRSSSKSRSRPVQQTKSYEDRLLDELLDQHFDDDIDIHRLPQEQQMTYQGPQMQLPTQDGDHFMDPNLEEPTERIHFERDVKHTLGVGPATGPQQGNPFEQRLDINTPQHQKEEKEEELFDPFGGEWSPEDDKRRWDMPYEPSPAYPTPTIASTQPRVQATKSFPTAIPKYPTNRNGRPKTVDGTKSFPSSGGISPTVASSQKSQERGGDWKSNIMKTTMVSLFRVFFECFSHYNMNVIASIS